jgi:hypothetical protein
MTMMDPEPQQGEEANLPHVWPGSVELEGIVENTTALSAEQEARSEALSHARIVLEKRGAMNTNTPPPLNELIRVANFILTGEHQP